MKNTKARRTPLVLAVALATASAGCMGSFTLTKGLYAWNDSVTDSKIINNVIFWVLAILPAYELAVLGDVVILNTIEFWTGARLFADAGAAEGGEALAVREHEDGTLTLTRGADVYVLTPLSADVVRIEKNGVVVGTAVRGADGSVTAEDATAVAFATASPADVEAGTAAAARALVVVP